MSPFKVIRVSLLVLCGIGIGVGLSKLTIHHDTELINPILDTKLGSIVQNNENINLEYELQKYEAILKLSGDIANIAVYFRNLSNGNWFGYNEKELFSPASLMKLPILLAYFKKEELHPGTLDQRVVFTRDPDNERYKQNIQSEITLVSGKEYKIIDVLEQMILYSDNEAAGLLEEQINIADIQKVFTDIGITFPPFVDGAFDNNVRVVDYASFFRVLFNASYLNAYHSKQVLKMLTQTSFEDGLVRGIGDSEIAVAHKFGERSLYGKNGIERMQLHDCGIVYYPSHPYLMCIMTRGYSWTKLKEVVGDISHMIYTVVDKAYTTSASPSSTKYK